MSHTIKIKGSWLAACGKGPALSRELEVIEVIPTLAREGSGFEVMYKVNCDGHEWVVAKCRLVGER